MNTQVKVYLQIKTRRNRIQAVSMGEYLVPKGNRAYALNIFTGEMKQLMFNKSRCILLTKSEVPIKALNESTALKKANARLREIQINLPKESIIRSYAHK